MNIEDSSPAGALRSAARNLGHVHFADSNRRAFGFGHTDIPPILAALRDIGYADYLSGKIIPVPDSLAAAAQTARAFQTLASMAHAKTPTHRPKKLGGGEPHHDTRPFHLDHPDGRFCLDEIARGHHVDKTLPEKRFSARAKIRVRHADKPGRDLGSMHEHRRGGSGGDGG